ncbi:hydrogenase formation protein HypD [Shewanella fidelis]|uniref:Hydrogenase maturation factor n=1 Tax=Shewanella fidelis TaxID=173509 RepID=A0AAW8NL54_9GAMM|nr:hydrogenase formation protein HypD [Shewanella fidelis]MDR8523933.1 hydrogenase formation protein HypD [Shewanella fidelis]MDW4810480.1 hydrogenase formation protein HypD [Shewanella fidelis]MDW4814601.1 hydrogenase formation protein HypD [Shewanella fidelis]MDW4818691.1 hydrogenase formation protein HypD [Shewanella fidelis]MDW4823632.1 hydrogenase formation protein HypD [Shewanella fidelis]
MIALTDLYQGFRDPKVIRSLAQQISHYARQVEGKINIMEVCGGHTHTIMKYGLNQLLPNNIEFIHGPGCPVCIMPKERIDHAATLASQPDTILVTLGDMIRVPGSKGSLAQFRAKGCDIRPIYDPLDTLTIAADNPDKTIIFFAIGFETSTPMTAVLIDQANQRGINNLLFHINHVLVPPAIDAVMSDPLVKVNAFIGPAHVSVISGAKIYRQAVDTYNTPVVVSGFEPVDVMQSILMLVKQKAEQRAELENQYSRSVSENGNQTAQALIDKYLTIRPEFRWRGLGPIENSALMLKPEYAHLDAERVYANVLPQVEIDDHKACQCGDILRGLCKPKDCKVFGRGCSPDTPLGSCMVSSEGACNAYYRYNGVNL